MDVAADSQPKILLERVVLRAKVCMGCGHPNPYRGNWPDGSYDEACDNCGADLRAVPAGQQELETVEVHPKDVSPALLDRIRQAMRKG